MIGTSMFSASDFFESYEVGLMLTALSAINPSIPFDSSSGVASRNEELKLAATLFKIASWNFNPNKCFYYY